MTASNGDGSTSRIARIVGLTFILATVAGVLSVWLLGPVLEDPEQIAWWDEYAGLVVTGALIELIMAAAILAIPVVLFPILKKHSESIAVGYVVARGLEGVLVVISVVGLLSLLTVGQEMEAAGALDYSEKLGPLGTALLAVREWADLLATQLVFGVTALILNYSLHRTKLIPRFLSAWGFIGGILIIAAGLLAMYGAVSPFSTISILLYAPIALQEMVFAVWLIVRGFNSAALDTSQ